MQCAELSDCFSCEMYAYGCAFVDDHCQASTPSSRRNVCLEVVQAVGNRLNTSYTELSLTINKIPRATKASIVLSLRGCYDLRESFPPSSRLGDEFKFLLPNHELDSLFRNSTIVYWRTVGTATCASLPSPDPPEPTRQTILKSPPALAGIILATTGLALSLLFCIMSRFVELYRSNINVPKLKRPQNSSIVGSGSA